MKVYRVIGSSGEYSDFSEWTVKTFSDKAKAEEFVVLLNKEDAALRSGERKECINNLDPQWHSGYGATTDYEIEELEVE